MSAERPLLALTLGDPAGIGPEVVLKALLEGELQARWWRRHLWVVWCSLAGIRP